MTSFFDFTTTCMCIKNISHVRAPTLLPLVFLLSLPLVWLPWGDGEMKGKECWLGNARGCDG